MAQISVQHQVPIALEREEPTPIEFHVPGLSESEIQNAVLYYRFDEGFSFQQKEILFQNNAFVTSFNLKDNNTGSIEYYFEITMTSGEKLYYPENSPDENPVRVEIVNQLGGEERKLLQDVEFTILTPKSGVGVQPEDAIIALALFYDPAQLPEGEYRLLIDNLNVTADADTSAYYISYIPENLRPGPHTVTLEYVTPKEKLLVTEWDFYVVTEERNIFYETAQNYTPIGQVELSARNQVVAGDINNAYTGRTSLSGSYGDLQYTLNGYFTSQESHRLQPQNRYGLKLQLDEWWKFEAGHVYPDMSKFTISGRRVHGINTSLHLLRENLNFQLIYGELDRAVDNLYSSLQVEEVLSGSGEVVDKHYVVSYENQGRGVFRRNVVGGRVGLGNPEKFQLGFHALKVQDDTTSLVNIRNYNDLMRHSLFINTLSEEDHVRLQQNPDLLDVDGGFVRPRDNFVAGTDLKFGFSNNRIRWESEAVISALNDDIYGGPLTAERAEEMGFDIDQEIVDMLEQLSWLIIVNENMNTLPIKLSDEDGEIKSEVFFPTSIIGGNSELSFRYPRNNFRLQYRWIGPNFNSLANTTVRKDVAGFTLSDRMNFLSNRLYITLGYENLQDNVANTRDATTQTNTYRTNASWYPINSKLPRINLGLRYRMRDNSIDRFNTEVPFGFENAAVQNLRISGSGDTLSTVSPRRNNTVNVTASVTQQLSMLDMLHDISLNFTNMKTTDEVFAFGDIKSSAVSVNLTSRFSNKPIRTQLGLTFNNTESGSGQNAIKIFGVYAGGNIILLDDRLSLNGRFAITSNSTSSRILDVMDMGDNNPKNNYYYLSNEVTQTNYATYAIQTGAQYNLDDHHALIFDANLTNVSGVNRANDHLVQFRYVFRF